MYKSKNLYTEIKKEKGDCLDGKKLAWASEDTAFGGKFGHQLALTVLRAMKSVFAIRGLLKIYIV